MEYRGATIVCLTILWCAVGSVVAFDIFQARLLCEHQAKQDHTPQDALSVCIDGICGETYLLHEICSPGDTCQVNIDASDRVRVKLARAAKGGE